ncbi:MAG: hypothetical protein JW850_23965 [Thermoflexales bacterium]|nr:hypothetical protein [Thermoflexales bacterium]
MDEMERLCQEHGVLIEHDGVVRVPFLVKGELIAPPAITRAEIEAAFAQAEADASYVKTARAQLVRERVIDRTTMRYTGDYLYQVLPPLNPLDVIETDFAKLVRGPYALTVAEILQYLQAIAEALSQGGETAARALELCRRTSEHPDLYLDGAFAAMQTGLDVQAARYAIDNELAVWGMAGSKFLDGWVELPSTVIPGLVPLFAQMLPDAAACQPMPDAKPLLRAMPTRQLHITAGNAPEVPMISALRLILTKSAGVVKAPFGTTIPGALLALAAVSAAPEHPLTQHISLVYWQGGDESIESVLFGPGAFDRIVVWGAPDAVASVQSRAVFTKTICFNPRYGISMIGKECFSADATFLNVASVAFAAAMDALIYNQKACTASQVQYVEGTQEQVEVFADHLARILAQWDTLAPQFVPPARRGQIKRMQRGRYARAKWLVNSQEGEFASGVVVMPDEFNVLDHPMCRLTVVRRVDDLGAVLPYLHQGVSMVGVYPEERRVELRDLILARGVSSVLPLGQCERFFPGGPQDGMFVLNQLVDWKNG